MASPLAAAKQQLRKLVKQRLAAVSQDSIQSQSQRIFDALKQFKPYQDAHRISIFLSMPVGEVQTDAVVRHALDDGKQVFIPYLHKSPLDEPGTPPRVMDMVCLADLSDYQSLQNDSWGIPSVDPATVHTRQRILGGRDAHKPDESGLDLMLIPGVAFDLDGAGAIRRLGHGKGFYDFFLNRYTAKQEAANISTKPMLFYGLGLTEQFLAESDGAIPMGQFDRTLHGVVLGDGVVKESRRDSTT